jgi:hypothetical protein
MINEHHSMERIRTTSRSSQRILGYSAVASSLQADLRAVLRSYVGKQILSSRRATGSSGSGNNGSSGAAQALSTSSGTVVSGFIESDHSFIVVEWHASASKSVIRLREFLQSGQFRVLDSPSSSSSFRHPSSLELKRRGAMKYA